MILHRDRMWISDHALDRAKERIGENVTFEMIREFLHGRYASLLHCQHADRQVVDGGFAWILEPHSENPNVMVVVTVLVSEIKPKTKIPRCYGSRLEFDSSDFH